MRDRTLVFSLINYADFEPFSDELHQVDDQIAAYAQEHIHSNEVSSSDLS